MAKANILFSETTNVPLSELKMYPNNPRRGDVSKIAESLRLHGQYRPLVVQQSTHHILAGNHTYQAAESLGWDSIAVTYIDVDDEAAARIVLVDNKTSDMGEYDNTALAEVLASLPDVAGTGYEQQEVDILIDVYGAVTDEVIEFNGDMTVDGPTLQDVMTKQHLSNEEPLPSLDHRNELAREKGKGPDFSDDKEVETLDELAELQGILTLKEDVTFSGSNKWGVPDLRFDGLCQSLPRPLDTWGGKDATPDDGITTYLWNYGVASMSGLPFDRAILCFYTHDHYFENWWSLPAYYTAKLITAGIKTAVVPDFSFYYTEPRVIHLHNVYRAQWLGRYFQEAGLKVIPRIQFDYKDKNSLEIALLGIPKNAPVMAHSAQNFENDQKHMLQHAKHLTEALAEIQPKTLLLYGGNPALKMMENVDYSGEVVHLENYAAKRRGVVFDKKEGLAKKGTGKKKKAKAEEPVAATEQS